MKFFRFISIAWLALALGCATAKTSSPPALPDASSTTPSSASEDPQPSTPPQVTLTQRAQSATEGLLIGGIVGSQAGPIGAIVVGGLGMIYGAATGEAPLQGGGGKSKPNKSESEREEELDKQIESGETRQAALEDAIQEELERQEDLLRQIEIEEAGRADTETTSIAATAPDASSQTNPRISPSAPQERELALSLFEEKQTTIPKGQWGNTKEIRVLRYTIDADHDKKPEEIRYLDLSTGQLLRIEKDQNYDGTIDLISLYQNHQLTQRNLDTNNDGKLDVWEKYTNSRMTYREIDRNFDGISDAFYLYHGEWLSEERHDSNGDSKIDRLLFYANGTLARSEEDRDRNGSFDTWTTYQTSDGQEFVARIERDTNGDGKRDFFETYAFDGTQALLRQREEDTNGDGSIDITSFYEKGKLVRREVADPALVPL